MLIGITKFTQSSPWGGVSGKEPACQCRRHNRWGFNPWVRKIPWRRWWQPIPVVLPGKSHGQRSLAGYSPWGRKGSDVTEQLNIAQHNSRSRKIKSSGCFSRQWYFFPHDTGNIFSLKQAQGNCTPAFVFLHVYASQEPAKTSILNSMSGALDKNFFAVMLFTILM